MLSATLDLQIDQNSNFTRNIVWTDEDNAAKQLYGYTVWITIYKGTESVVTLQAPHVVVDQNVTGLINIDTPWEVIGIPIGYYTYSLLATSISGLTTKLLQGKLQVR